MKLGKRLMEKHRLAFAVSPEVVRDIVLMCTTSQSGARNIDTVIDQKLMPLISGHLLRNMAEDKVFTHLFLSSDGRGGFGCSFSVGEFQLPEAPEEAAEAEGASEGEDGGKTRVLEREKAE
jgi:hypothetical protein